MSPRIEALLDSLTHGEVGTNTNWRQAAAAFPVEFRGGMTAKTAALADLTKTAALRLPPSMMSRGARALPSVMAKPQLRALRGELGAANQALDKTKSSLSQEQVVSDLFRQRSAEDGARIGDLAANDRRDPNNIAKEWLKRLGIAGAAGGAGYALGR